ncbi:MAG: ABC transporter permease [Roseitalea sp.]|nr:ABC transporter permease [Roseitalea sp.]MBO6950906.1 ABC transporter permease [Rhizobiaceae bacterium]MBO6591107.1 ABC transporter permease [Roseitalea sp.]MBO6599635.1 ABC transporter permease [Roseitalea sp.]MBO6613886.1 ABC transporter permease [Roseitalea sp.]
MTRIVRSIWSERELIAELSRRELFQAHAGHIFGGVWVFANPILTLLVYFAVFRFVFPTRLPGEGSPEAFLLAGIVQWIITAEVLAKACTVIRSNAGLVKQINFPIEALVVKTVFASLFLQVVMTVGLLIILLPSGTVSVTSVILWVAAFSIQGLFLLGVALIIASVTPFLPDLTEIVGLVARLGLFVTPILYPATQFGPFVEAGFHLNPFSYYAWIHQDAIFNAAITNPWHWLGAVVIAVLCLAVGQAVFRVMNPAFNDVL